ncbi:DNA mismatch repair protein MutL [Bienertia sinuspersici]
MKCPPKVNNGSKNTPCSRRDITLESDSGESAEESNLKYYKSDNSQDDNYKQFEEFDSDDDMTYMSKELLHKDEMEGDMTLAVVEDKWQLHKWHDFIDNDDNDDDYFSRLYRNGELYENKQFGNIQLKPWMIFTEKSHFKDTLKDYCVQEGFAITVLWANKSRYTATCAAKCCEWRVHASKLPDGRTWAIKKLWPDFHTCRGLETYNPFAM